MLELNVAVGDMKTSSVQLVAAVGPVPSFATVQLTVKGWPEKACDGATTLETSSAGGGVNWTLNAALTSRLLVRFDSGSV